VLLQALAEFQKAPKTNVRLPESQFDTDDLIERLMGDGELARRLAAAFVDSMPEQLATLATAIGNSDAQATRFAAHSIKGVAAVLGCAAIRDLASMMEELGENGPLAHASEVLPEFAVEFEAR